jgi:hypothetical protein
MQREPFFHPDFDEKIDLPVTYEVCYKCEGSGKIVNPAIDEHGISQEEFDEDPDFEEAYFSGVYDIQCPLCKGKRVLPIVDKRNLTKEEKTLWREIQEYNRESRKIDEISRQERLYGA